MMRLESAGETDDDRSTFDGIDMYEEDEHIAKETAELPNSSSGDDDGEPPVTASKKRKSPPPQAKKRKKDPNAPKNARSGEFVFIRSQCLTRLA